MEKIDQILSHKTYRSCYAKIEKWEKERTFCHHDMVHFLDVARLMRILNLEEQLHIEEEMIYAAALLHDIGRHVQYETRLGHEKASAQIAPNILRDCGFEEDKVKEIVRAILMHRTVAIAEEKTLAGILYRADKLSRPCFFCKEEEQCNWKNEKKNMQLRY